MTKKNDEKLYRRYIVRLFPTPEQEELMWKHVHATRFVWNYLLALQSGRYRNGRKYMTKYEMVNEITIIRKECGFEWLKEIPSNSLAKVCGELDLAYKRFFKKTSKYPKFKSKKDKQSFLIDHRPCASYFKQQDIFVAPGIGQIKCAHNYVLPTGRRDSGHNLICEPRIKYIKSSNKWILSFSIECEKQAKELTDKSMGIDLGVKELAVVAVGDKKLVFGNINKSKRMRALEKKKKHVERAISRKYETSVSWRKSKNIEKYEQILREICAKQSNIRHNYIHQITRKLVNMLPERVVMETLMVSNMIKNKHLAKSISEQNFYFFIQTMKYKCEEYDIEFVQADRFYPSSKTCSDCGYVNKNLKLKDRMYICPNCGLKIDRDCNAAINLMNYTEKSTTANYLVESKLSA